MKKVIDIMDMSIVVVLDMVDMVDISMSEVVISILAES